MTELVPHGKAGPDRPRRLFPVAQIAAGIVVYSDFYGGADARNCRNGCLQKAHGEWARRARRITTAAQLPAIRRHRAAANRFRLVSSPAGIG